MSAPGFYKTPVTKALFYATLGSSVLIPLETRAKLLNLDLNAVLSKGEFYRLLSCHGPFRTTSELVVGLFLLYKFRLFERMLGSEKFGAFVVYATSLATSLSAGVALSTSIRPTSGPYPLLYAMFVLHHVLVPPGNPKFFGLFGVDFTNKSLYYFAGIPLLLSQGTASVLPGACGALAGWLYANDSMSLQAFRLPKPIERFFQAFAPLFRGTPPRPLAAPGARQGQAGRRGGAQGGGQPAAAQQQVPLQPPPQEAIDQLMGMGFDQDRVVRALQETGNNVQVAADRLLSGMG